MTTNRNFGTLDADSNIVYAPAVIDTPTGTNYAPTEADYRAIGAYPIVSEPPVRVGVSFYQTERGELRDGTIYRIYGETPIVAPVKCYKVEDIIYGLIGKNALQAVKAIVGDYWELFTMRDIIQADNELWVENIDAFKAAIVASGALTAEEFDAILADAEVS